MISVLIPVFNQSILALAQELSTQAKLTKKYSEIIFLDDGSASKWKLENRKVEQLEKCRYEELQENVGRSKIRNLLATRAAENYLLFLDGDSQIINDLFLTGYLPHIAPDQVVVGGRKFPEICPDKKQRLHWLSGRLREKKDAAAFLSNNFLISKNLFTQVGGFDESLEGYGHEDTLFGHKIKALGKKIRHIDNPTLHIDLKEGPEFISDQEEAIKNLKKIVALYPELETSLVRVIRQIHTLHLTSMMRILFSITRSHFRTLLANHWPNLLLLDLYKIGYYLDQNNVTK